MTQDQYNAAAKFANNLSQLEQVYNDKHLLIYCQAVLKEFCTSFVDGPFDAAPPENPPDQPGWDELTPMQQFLILFGLATAPAPPAEEAASSDQ